MTRLLLGRRPLAAGCAVVFSAPGKAQPRIRREVPTWNSTSPPTIRPTDLGRTARSFVWVSWGATGTIPVGTEDLGEVRLGADVWLGRWLLDAGASVGYAGNSPEWGASGGVSLLLN